MKASDLQDRPPETPIPLERVGIRGYRRRITVNAPEGTRVYDAVVDAYISIGPERRGVHLSRNVEAFIEAMEYEAVPGVEEPIEAYLERVARRLLEKHPYARRAQVIAHLTDYLNIEWNGNVNNEAFDVSITVTAWRDGSRVWRVEVTVPGITACPHAMETIRELIDSPGKHIPTHTQKAFLRLSVETRGRMVRFDLLAREAIKSFSAPTLSLLKRYSEAKLILSALEKPRLAEDVVRDAADRAKRLAGSSAVSVCARLESLESIHPFNVYAEVCLDTASRQGL